jgi:hypothetical protein
MPYPDVNALLHELLSSVQTILGDHFVGMYLYGSLAIGDFTPHRSDIDFLVVTADVLPGEVLSALKAMHARIATSGSRWATELEGSYIPQHALRRYGPTQTLHPHIDRGEGERLEVRQHDCDWIIQRHVLREHGVVMAGPALDRLIDPVSPNELRGAVLELLREWWAPMLDDPTQLQEPGYRAYATLSMGRMLYTLQYGTVVSKTVAARWAQETLDKRWIDVIEQALAWPHGAQPDNLNETLDFIRYTLERSQQFEISAG